MTAFESVSNYFTLPCYYYISSCYLCTLNELMASMKPTLIPQLCSWHFYDALEFLIKFRCFVLSLMVLNIDGKSYQLSCTSVK